MKVKNDHHSKFSNFSKKKPEKIRASTGFEPVTSANTSATLYQLSYEATHWERGLLSNCLNWKIHCNNHSSLKCLCRE